MGTTALHSALFINLVGRDYYNGERVTSDDGRNEIDWTRRTGCVVDRERGEGDHGWFRIIYCFCI